MTKRNRIIIAAILAALMLLFLGAALSSCGRTSSRYLGKEHRQVLKVENCQKVISVSFDKRDGSTVKDVTFLATDGYLYTQEFKDVSPFEGVIRWIPAGEKKSIIQSRAISRWTGGTVNAELPDDFASVLNVDIGYSSKEERAKNLVYLSTDGNIYAKEYRDGFIERNLSGWLEVKPVKK